VLAIVLPHFNPSTTIKIGLPVRSHVTIGIFNLLGQQVAEIANGSMEAGYHSFLWNAPVASGVYFCRMEAVSDGTPGQRFQQTLKIMLLK
jgi:flagellar hook assembly protein FlgD